MIPRKTMIRAGLSVLLLAGAVSRGWADGLLVEQQVQFADALYARGLYDLALDEYLRISREHPDLERMDQVLYRAGESHRRLGNPRAAERFYWRIIHEFPASEYQERAAFRRAEVLLALGRDRDAFDLFQAFLETAPALPELRAAATYYQAEAARKLGMTDHAVELLESVLDTYRDHPFAAYAALDLAGIWRDDPEQAGVALLLYQRVLAEPPTATAAAEAWFQKADWHFGLSDYDAAAAAYDRLRTDHPTSSRARESALQAAWSFYHVGRLADALRLAERALTEAASERQRVEWLYLLANTQRQLLNADAARTAYQKLIELDGPDGEWTRIASYELALMAFRRDEFESVLELATAVEPDAELRVDLYWLLAESYAGVGRMDEAVQYYRLLLDAAPQGDYAPRALYRLARILQNRRDFAEAARTYRRLATEFPYDPLVPDAWMGAAFCASVLGRFDDALTDWQRLVEQFPAHELAAEARYQSALVHLQAERPEQALAEFAALLEAHPASRWTAEAQYWTGVMQQAQGDFPAAEQSFRAALAARPVDELARQVNYRLAVNLHQQGGVDEAADLLQNLLAAPDQSMPSSLLEWLALYRLEQGQAEQALLAADTLLRAAESDAWRQIGSYLKGRALQDMDQLDAALAAFRQSVELAAQTRDGAEAALHMGDIHVQQEDWDAAARRYQEAATRAQDEWVDVRARAYTGLGRVAELSGDDRAAARYYLAVGIFFDDEEWVPSALRRAAAALEREGRIDEQQRTLAELAERFPEYAMEESE